MDRFRILVADDEEAVRKLIARVLESEGMRVVEAGNGLDVISLAGEQTFDLIILDIMMGEMDGFQVIQKLRSLGVLTPVFVLSGCSTDNDKVFALGIGADDYVTKPFSPSVLCAKIKASLRRAHIAESRSAKIEAGPFTYLCDEMRLYKEGVELPLSSKESLMVRYFMSNPGKVLTKEHIYLHVWGDAAVDDNTIMVYIRRLRMKIEDDPNEPQYLKTVRGIGYSFSGRS